MKLISVKKSSKNNYKLVATFDIDGKIKTVHFGSKPNKDFIIYSKTNPQKAEIMKAAYIARHSKNNEDWNNPITKGCLSRFILWNKNTLRESIKNYKNRFNL